MAFSFSHYFSENYFNPTKQRIDSSLTSLGEEVGYLFKKQIHPYRGCVSRLHPFSG